MATRLTLAQLISDRLTLRLGVIQNLAVLNMVGKHTSSTAVDFHFGNWNAAPAPLYRKNGTIFTPTSTDTTLGTATISDLVAHDDITADFNFKYFSTTDLENFFKLSMSHLNNLPPSGDAFDFDTYATDHEEYLVMYAYKLCLETVLMDLMSYKYVFIWKDPAQFAGFLQNILGGINAYFISVQTTVKGRRFLSPRSIAAGKYSVGATVQDHTWQRFTTIRA
jgi:hypothetical protein